MRSDERTGLLFALCGFTLLSCGDGVIKSMTGDWPPTAIAAVRYFIGAVLLGALLLAREGRQGFAFPRPAVQLLRGTAVALATVGFFTAIVFLPLAQATAITFTSPMITALLASVFLGEPARRETWIASAIAFAGVLIVIRPSFAEIGLAALFPVVSALGMSLLVIGNRMVAGQGSALAMQFNFAALAVPLLILATWAGDASGLQRFAVSPPDWTVLLGCAVVACTASLAHTLVYLGTTRAGAAMIAPMTYVQLLVALGIGWAVFAETPDAVAMFGAAVIVAAGLYLWRSRPSESDRAGG